jgi:hypothetical protein
LADLPGLEAPAMAHYACSTPRLLAWFAHLNRDRPYREQVRPFNFLLAGIAVGPAERGLLKERYPSLEALLAKFEGRKPYPVAPFDRDPARAAGRCHDRLLGLPIPEPLLQTYADVLAFHWLHPVDKFLNGDYLDEGETQRRHICVVGVEHIGKEAHRWEERSCLGDDPEAQVEYGYGEEDIAEFKARILAASRSYGVRELAREANLSIGLLSGMRSGQRPLSTRSMVRLSEVLPLRQRTQTHANCEPRSEC